MYRVLLVEDEDTVREGIVQKIDWEAHGFDLAGACENGKQALDMLEQQWIDLVITDINMPVMDGLALTQKIHTLWPDTRIVILTGFDNFDYAQKAIRYRVNEYILKPITARQLRDLLDKMRQELDSQLPKAEIASAKEALRDKLIQRLLSESVERNEALQKVREFSLALKDETVCCVKIIPRNDMEFVQLKKMATEYNIELHQNSATISLLCTGKSPRQLLLDFLCEYRVVYGALTGIVGEQQEHLGEAFRSLLGIEAVWENLYLMPQGSIYSIDEATPERKETSAPDDIRRTLVKEIKLLNKLEAQRLLEQLIAALRDSGWQRDDVLRRLRRLVEQVSQYAEEQGWQLEQNAIERLNAENCLDGASAFLTEYIQSAMTAGELESDSTARQGLRAVEYIKENYSSANLSLQDMTALLSVSTSYFSSMFKSYTGVTFIEFLTRMRINKAKDLLVSTDLKSYEIAGAVGYDDAAYFGSLFKKATGQSPSMYRKNESIVNQL